MGIVFDDGECFKYISGQKFTNEIMSLYENKSQNSSKNQRLDFLFHLAYWNALQCMQFLHYFDIFFF